MEKIDGNQELTIEQAKASAATFGHQRWTETQTDGTVKRPRTDVESSSSSESSEEELIPPPDPELDASSAEDYRVPTQRFSLLANVNLRVPVRSDGTVPKTLSQWERALRPRTDYNEQLRICPPDEYQPAYYP